MKIREIHVGRAYTNGRGKYRRVLARDDYKHVQVAEITPGKKTARYDDLPWIALETFARWATLDLPWSDCCNVAYRIEGRTTRYAVCPSCGKPCNP